MEEKKLKKIQEVTPGYGYNHTGAIIKWKRPELKEMYLLTEGTSRAVFNGTSMSLSGIWHDKQIQTKLIKHPACKHERSAAELLFGLRLCWPQNLPSPVWHGTETDQKKGLTLKRLELPQHTDLRIREKENYDIVITT